MRILFWSSTFWPNVGGVEVLAARLLPALRTRGYEFTVVTPKSHSALPDQEKYQGIPIHRFSFRNDSTPSIIDYVIEMREKVVKLKHTFDPDLIHINAVGRGDFFHLVTNTAYKAPFLVTLHGQWEKRIEPIVEHTLRNADWVAGCSAAIIERGRQLVPEIVSHSSVIHNGFELPLLTPQPLPFDAPRILCLGRLAQQKGFDLALGAFRSIIMRFPRARLIIAGNGPARTELEKQAAKEKISHAVEFIGWVAPEGVPALINDATMVLMPSRQDSFPLVALEAAGMARPVVATRVGGLPEIVLHKQTGLLVDKEDREGLAQAVFFLIDNPDAAVQMGNAARRRVETAFSWERHVDAYDALYRQLIKQTSLSKGKNRRSAEKVPDLL
jgi:glycogen(starch) synthase